MSAKHTPGVNLSGKNLTMAEMRADYNATAEDQGCLTVLVDCLRRFITDSHGEDRTAYRMDLMKYESLLNHAKRLKAVIRERIDAAEASKQPGLSSRVAGQGAKD